MDINELKEFLVKAKKSTYANSNAPKIESTRLDSKDYEYKEIINGNKFTYHDTYFGGINFIGEEIVYKDDLPIWGMNYYGVTIDNNLSEEAMDKALRPALMQVGTDNSIPVRGPKEYYNNEYSYAFEYSGELDNFKGKEQIKKSDNLIYELNCHGGFIK